MVARNTPADRTGARPAGGQGIVTNPRSLIVRLGLFVGGALGAYFTLHRAYGMPATAETRVEVAFAALGALLAILSVKWPRVCGQLQIVTAAGVYVPALVAYSWTAYAPHALVFVACALFAWLTTA